jgi:tRNA(fMet)-specific endonuclease VapC
VKVLDSDHLVALLRGRLDLSGRAEPQEELAMTAVSLGELVHGAYKSEKVAENLARIDVLLSGFTVLPLEARAARIFGRLRAELESSGTRLDDLDLEVAGICLAWQAPLFTHNRRHFDRIPGLQVDDWLG